MLSVTMTRVMQPWIAIFFAAAAGCLAPSQPFAAEQEGLDVRTEFGNSLTELPDTDSLNVRGNVYVPIYSRIRAGAAQTLINVSTTLRIDNTSSNKPIVINRIDYFDTSGKLVQRYISAPIALRPYGAIQISIAADDARGGPAANFIVSWAGSGPIAEPLIEAVMVGTEGGSSYSFVSQGRTIRTVGRSRWFDFGKIR
jgi:hypothetical protein